VADLLSGNIVTTEGVLDEISNLTEEVTIRGIGIKSFCSEHCVNEFQD